jgi:hypothetical protein
MRQLLQDRQLKTALREHRQLHDLDALHHAAEEIQEAVERVEGPSAVLVLQLPRAV